MEKKSVVPSIKWPSVARATGLDATPGAQTASLDCVLKPTPSFFSQSVPPHTSQPYKRREEPQLRVLHSRKINNYINCIVCSNGNRIRECRSRPRLCTLLLLLFLCFPCPPSRYGSGDNDVPFSPNVPICAVRRRRDPIARTHCSMFCLPCFLFCPF